MNQKIKDEVFKYLKIFELPVDEQIDLDVLSSKYNDFCKKYDPSLTDSLAYKDGEKFREIKESYFFLKTKIDYVNKIIEAEKGEKENAIGDQNKSAQKSDDKPNKYSSDSQNDEALERAKDLVLARLLNKINNTGKDEYSKKNYESVKEKIEAFEKQINSYTDKKNLEKDYSSLVKEIEKIPTVETERIKKLKFTSIVGGIVAVAVVVLIFVVSIVRGIPIKQVNQAKELLINGDYATAEQLLETAGTERAQLLLQQIDVYKNLNEGNYDEAHYLFIPFGNVQIEYITGDGYVVYTDFVEGMKNTYYVSAKPDYDFMGYTIDHYEIYDAELIIYLQADFVLHRYSINYDLDGGSIISELPEYFDVETPDLHIPQVKREGYNFEGWVMNYYDSPRKDFVIPQGTCEEVMLTACWTPKEYNITFDLAGGTSVPGNMSVEYDSYFTLPTPTKTGYDFLGWYYNNQKFNKNVWDITSDIKLVAKWTEKTCIISFDGAGGSFNGTDELQIKFGSPITLPTATRTGYTFLGWYYQGERFTDSVLDYNKHSQEMTLVAKWEAKTCAITFDPNGGSLSSGTTRNVKYDSYVSLPTPTKKGFVFSGWYYNNIRVYDGSWKYTDSVKLVAKWSSQSYTINYNLEGGVNNSKNPSHYDSGSTTPIYEPTREGYTFAGWRSNLSSTLNKSYSIPLGTTGNITLTAYWTALTYTITYDVNGGDALSSTKQTVTYGNYETLKKPTRPGYVFVGWYKGTTKVTDGTWKIASNVSLVAKWEVNYNVQYTVQHYYENLENDYFKLVYEEVLTGSTNETICPSLRPQTGFKSPSLQVVNINPDGSTLVTYFYTRNRYTITFMSNGGSSISSMIVKHGESFKLPTPSRSGYWFSGWYKDRNYSQRFYDYTGVTQNLTLYARWS